MADLTITEVQTPEAVARDKATAVRVCAELGMTDEKSANLAFTAILGARFDDVRSARGDDVRREREGAQPMYLIRKRGMYYRPNAQGYTCDESKAGRYTLADAISHSHPNGPDGPRDGIDYIPVPAILAQPDTEAEGLREALEVAAARLAWCASANPGIQIPEGKRLVAGWAEEARAALAKKGGDA